jgi:hypothetical protein
VHAARRRRHAEDCWVWDANYVESIGSPTERAPVAITSEGRVKVVIGTQPSGQGHETSFAQVMAAMLGVPLQCIDIILGDTDIVTAGGGSHSGRSMRHAATVFRIAADRLIEKRLEDRPQSAGRGRGGVCCRRTGSRSPRTASCTRPVFPYGCAVCECAAALRHAAILPRPDRAGALADESARHQGWRRRRHDARAGGGLQRDHSMRCASAACATSTCRRLPTRSGERCDPAKPPLKVRVERHQRNSALASCA